MKLIPMQPRSTRVTLVQQTPTDATDAIDATDACALQVCDDMTVEVALSVMAGARTGHLFICENDGLSTQLVTQAQLAAVRDSPEYTDRVQLRDILGGGGPSAAPTLCMNT
ncbi:hypothetical protein [Streptomyces sp. NPDC020607]|uniref:hypothetical protein n=1 Tax=Streptomyces sp. NPDC020607 TaxID=3365082 RepID=UPI0037971D48